MGGWPVVGLLAEPLKIVQAPKETVILYEIDGVELEFTPDGLQAVADQALLRGTGARGLRAIMEEVLLNTMYDLPGRTDIGKAIRAVAKERVGARLVGIDVDRVFAISYGIGLATLGAAACLLMPIFYVSPTTGHVFVMVAFTVVVLGGMGSFLGAVVGGLIVGLTESFGGLFLGESLGQIGISLIFILILLFRPSGLFGAKQ